MVREHAVILSAGWAAVLMIAAAAPAPAYDPPSSAGRYQLVATAGGQALLLDTSTGRVWSRSPDGRWRDEGVPPFGAAPAPRDERRTEAPRLDLPPDAPNPNAPRPNVPRTPRRPDPPVAERRPDAPPIERRPDAPRGERGPDRRRVEPRLELPARSVELLVVQREERAIPGSDGTVLVRLGDITGDQAFLSVHTANGRTVLERRSVSQGERVGFRFGTRSYTIEIVELKNLLVGDDFAKLRIIRDQGESGIDR